MVSWVPPLLLHLRLDPPLQADLQAVGYEVLPQKQRLSACATRFWLQLWPTTEPCIVLCRLLWCLPAVA